MRYTKNLEGMFSWIVQNRARVVAVAVPLLFALIIAHFVFSPGNDDTIVMAEILPAAVTTSPPSPVGGVHYNVGIGRTQAMSSSCDDDVSLVISEALYATASADLRTAHATTENGGNATDRSLTSVISRRNLRLALYRTYELWSFSAMEHVIRMLRQWHEESLKNTAAQKVTLSSMTTVQR
ncbi:transmembrane protein, putative, partial [Bodo saltans]